MFIGFFERLRGDAPVRVFLILGNLCAHLSRILKAWLREHAEFTELVADQRATAAAATIDHQDAAFTGLAETFAHQ